MVTTVKFSPHPLAKLFPRMDADAMRDLVADVKKHGLQEPITLFAGMVLDGVHRQEACAIAEREPRYVHFEKLNGSTQEAGPLAFVMSRNLRRRHLTASQKAAVARDAMPFFEAEAAKRKAATQFKKDGDRQTAVTVGEATKGTAAAQAAKTTGASERMVERAKKLQKESPAKFEKVKAGKLSLSKAEADKAKTEAMKQSLAAAIARIEQVCGKELASAVRNKARLKNPKDVLAFANQTDAEMQAQAGLIELAWPLKKAQLFRTKNITKRHTIEDLLNKTASEGFSLSIDLDGWRINVERTTSALNA